MLTLDDLTALRDKAKVYSQGNTFCRVLYRNKPPQYFSDVAKKADIMTVYVKDNSGDQASPINGQIDGLFRDLTHRLFLAHSTYYLRSAECRLGEPLSYSETRRPLIKVPVILLRSVLSNWDGVRPRN